ncbi:hypothetical protein pSALSNUABM04_020 [Salmonella phage pSal-SNUABM-04]|nr:hypothetical protein pSALSNUABM04_020 [Salmonella phage pSal-SNUABM-04]
MKVFYDVSSRVVEFGATRFYEHVREHISAILTECQLEVTNETVDNLYHLYQRYAMAYVIGVTARNAGKFIENLVDEFAEGDEDSYTLATDRSGYELRQQGLLLDRAFEDIVVDELPLISSMIAQFPGCSGTQEEHEKAINMAAALFLDETSTELMGLASVIGSVCPGKYIEHYGDDFKGLVVVCEHETLF